MAGKKGGPYYLKICVSLFLLYYVFQKVGWQDLWKALKQADVYYLSLYICLGLFMTLVSAMKWSVLAKPHGIRASLPRMFWLYMVGYLFNNILPTSVGGDLIRVYELGKVDGKTREAMASVFMERVTGFTTLVLFGLLAVCLDQRYIRDERLLVLLAVIVMGYVAIVVVAFNRRLLSIVAARVRINSVKRAVTELQRYQEAIDMYKGHRLGIIYAIGYSIVFYASCVMMVYVGCLAFGVHVPVVKLLSAVPIMLILFMMPISIGGIGLKEWAYYFVLGMIGVSSAVGLGLALLDRGRTVAFGLLGGAVYPFVTEGQEVKATVLRRQVRPIVK